MKLNELNIIGVKVIFLFSLQRYGFVFNIMA